MATSQLLCLFRCTSEDKFRYLIQQLLRSSLEGLLYLWIQGSAPRELSSEQYNVPLRSLLYLFDYLHHFELLKFKELLLLLDDYYQLEPLLGPGSQALPSDSSFLSWYTWRLFVTVFLSYCSYLRFQGCLSSPHCSSIWFQVSVFPCEPAPSLGLLANLPMVRLS